MHDTNQPLLLLSQVSVKHPGVFRHSSHFDFREGGASFFWKDLHHVSLVSMLQKVYVPHEHVEKLIFVRVQR